MSNYDWFDNWTPDDDLKRGAPNGHCGDTSEHKHHVWGTTYKKGTGPRPHGTWYEYEAAPFFKCVGTPARTERFKDMLIRFHDDGKVTWFKPSGSLEVALRNVEKMREEAARVALQKTAEAGTD